MKRVRRCTFRYQSSDGQFTDRVVANWVPSTWPGSIEGFCELRQEERSFKIQKMSDLMDAETEEVITDPWSYFGLRKGAEKKQDMDTLTWEALPAIKALKFFTLTTRGFSKRERLRVLQFAEELCDLSAFSKEDLEAWLQKLWTASVYDGNTGEYEGLLGSIPNKFLPRCREYALWIASGSGRKILNPFWEQRALSEFSENPFVLEPEPPFE
jgi:hypothetical protein